MPRARTLIALPLASFVFACAAPRERSAPALLALGSLETPRLDAHGPESPAPVAEAPTPLAWPTVQPAASVPASTPGLATMLERAQSVERVREEVSYSVTTLGESHLLLGLQNFGSSQMWRPVDETWALALDTSYEDFGDVVGLEWGFALLFDNGYRYGPGSLPGSTETDDRRHMRLNLYEFSIGAHRTFLRDTALRPYVGAGLDFIYYDGEAKWYDDPTAARVRKTHKRLVFGLYAHAGITYQLSEDLQLGLDIRQVFGTPDTNFFFDGDLDYQRASLFLGWGG
ncbi:MAG: outer membrane beta-barrel protein [Planctomycetota bacterium]|nr:outer membrane beta-barrel protein [Planctomycetota bacterium]